MATQITETIKRWCCQPQDMREDRLHTEKVNGTSIPRYMICIHCNKRFEYNSYVDAAGSRDWDYREMK